MPIGSTDVVYLRTLHELLEAAAGELIAAIVDQSQLSPLDPLREGLVQSLSQDCQRLLTSTPANIVR